MIILSEFTLPHLYAFPTTWLLAITLISATTVSYMVAVAICRIYFHPLAHIPGPRLAAATHLYVFYHNGIRGGKLHLQTEKLHRRYGPVIRISPTEIHLSDPANYNRIYHAGSLYTKPHAFYNTFISGNAFAIPNNETAHAKRSAMAPLFSPKQAPELESIIQAKVKSLENRIRTRLRTVGKINLHYALRAMSVDIITEYASDNTSYGFLTREDFGKEYFVLARRMARFVWVFQQFPTLMGLLARVVPVWGIIQPLERRWTHKSCFDPILLGSEDVNDEYIDGGENKPIMKRWAMFRPVTIKGNNVPAVRDPKTEAYDALAVVSHTTGNPLTITAYNIAANQEIYRMLTTELTRAIPDPKSEPAFAKLEKLPFLTAVIQEGLRLSFGVLGRLPRVVPESGAEFNGYRVPAGTIVSMSSWMMHRNEELFPEPDKFDPSRWLDTKASNKILGQYLVTFSKGSRQCIGMPLAYCEMYIALGRLFRHFDDLTIEKKSLEDLAYDDFFIPYHRPDKEMFCFAGSGSNEP
ncbi:hypothetical protein GX50_07597 [[Emmonsia] crescens]|uniref:Trichodiene oxygenase n=1 Tax=[Emmonsia] crescens TaxID=73230 RepID=A0A2B7Z8T5_9EURO|nr:hypothetical protein GX50_07597 [Emmonsia crescens]